MHASDILKSKGYDVITLASDASLDDAIALLAQKNIGAVIVADADRKIQGILSERDIIRVLDGAPTGFRQSGVSEVMTKTVSTLPPSATLDELLSIMTKGRFRHVPITEGGKLVGMVSIGDVVKYRLAEAERETAVLKDYINAV